MIILRDKREYKNRLEFDLYIKVGNILIIEYYNITLKC
jgi:hypothetical protein